MSQREGAPQSALSSLLLRCVSCVLCRVPENQWGPVWELDAKPPPPPTGVAPYNYLKTRVKRLGWDPNSSDMER